MPPGDAEVKAIEDRLVALVKCVIAKARADAEFAEQLNELLLSDTLRAAIRSKGSKKSRQEVFDPVAYLSQHNATALQQCLAGKPLFELVEVATKEKLARPKAIKRMERDVLITELVAYAERRLNRTGVFIGNGKSERQPSESAQLQGEADSVTTGETA